MTCFRSFGVSTLLLSLCMLLAGQSGTPHHSMPDPPLEGTEMNAQMLRRMQRQQQKKRYEAMKRDSQRLLELATELKQYVDKSGENIMSLEVLKKAEEMEKLARQVKTNMRGE